MCVCGGVCYVSLSSLSASPNGPDWASLMGKVHFSIYEGCSKSFASLLCMCIMVTLQQHTCAHIFCGGMVSMYIPSLVKNGSLFRVAWTKNHGNGTNVSPQIWHMRHHSISHTRKCSWTRPTVDCWLRYNIRISVRSTKWQWILHPRTFSRMKNWMTVCMSDLGTDVGIIAMVFCLHNDK